MANITMGLHEEFDAIIRVSDSLKAVRKSGKWGLITGKGKIVEPYKYDSVAVYGNGMVSLEISSIRKRFLFNAEGEPIDEGVVF